MLESGFKPKPPKLQTLGCFYSTKNRMTRFTQYIAKKPRSIPEFRICKNVSIHAGTDVASWKARRCDLAQDILFFLHSGLPVGHLEREAQFGYQVLGTYCSLSRCQEMEQFTEAH